MFTVVLTVVSVLLAIGALWYARQQTLIAAQQTRIAEKQTQLAKEIQARVEEEQKEVRDWQFRHEALAVQLSRINVGLIVQPPGQYAYPVNLYATVFPSQELRGRIENYIVEFADHRARFAVRKPTPHELRSHELRRTVDEAATILEEFKRQNPCSVHYFTK